MEVAEPAGLRALLRPPRFCDPAIEKVCSLEACSPFRSSRLAKRFGPMPARWRQSTTATPPASLDGLTAPVGVITSKASMARSARRAQATPILPLIGYPLVANMVELARTIWQEGFVIFTCNIIFYVY